MTTETATITVITKITTTATTIQRRLDQYRTSYHLGGILSVVTGGSTTSTVNVCFLLLAMSEIVAKLIVALCSTMSLVVVVQLRGIRLVVDSICKHTNHER